MLGVIPLHDFALRGLWHTAFIGGLGLSAIAIVILFLSAYFAGTAPHLPQTAAALENLKPISGSWPPPIASKSLGGTPAALPVDASATKLTLLPRATDPGQAPPIDISDLPPPERHLP